MLFGEGMIVYIFNGQKFITINLPVKVSGMYPIYINERLVANISSKDDNWIIVLSEDYMSNEFPSGEGVLNSYDIYSLISNYGNETYKMLLVPKYDENVSQYNIFNSIMIVKCLEFHL